MNTNFKKINIKHTYEGIVISHYTYLSSKIDRKSEGEMINYESENPSFKPHESLLLLQVDKVIDVDPENKIVNWII